MALADIAFAVFPAHNLPDGVEPTLDSDATFDPENFSFPHGTHLCATEVDTETGAVTIRSYVCVDDIGEVVNPLIVEGQVHGGLAQGIAQALYEEAVHDDQGTLTTATFVDYLRAVGAPTCRTSPPTGRRPPSTTNPLGVKGVGEAGTIASTPAVVNAVLDAVRHLGVNDIEMPLSPQRVWRAVRDGAVTGRARPPRRARTGPTSQSVVGSGPTRASRRAAPGITQRPRERGMIPAAVRLPRTDHRRRSAALLARWRTPVRTPRSSAAARACCRSSGCGWPRRGGGRPGPDRRPARRP